MRGFLKKGVLVHCFSDQSGCVFLDLHSGETLSLLLSENEISKVLSGEAPIDEKNEHGIAIRTLIQKDIFVSVAHKKTHV